MEETMENSTSSNSSMYYVLGAVVLVAVIGAGYLLRPKAPAPGAAQPTAMTTPGPTPTPGPISRLGCDAQYYNPVIGFPKYYLSVRGGDVTGPTNVSCTMTVTQSNKVVYTEKLSSPLTAAPERGGAVFTCTTQGLDLQPTVPSKVDVQLVDDQGAKASCSAVFSLPRP